MSDVFDVLEFFLAICNNSLSKSVIVSFQMNIRGETGIKLDTYLKYTYVYMLCIS